MAVSSAEKAIRFTQRSKKWAVKEKEFLSAFTSGVNGGMRDFVGLLLDTAAEKQIIDIKGHKNRSRARLGVTSKSVIVNRTGQTRNVLKGVKFGSMDSTGSIRANDIDREVSITIKKEGSGFVARMDLSGRIGTAQKVLINKHRIRMFTAAASKVKTMWKKMIAAGLQTQMVKAKGAWNR